MASPPTLCAGGYFTQSGCIRRAPLEERYWMKKKLKKKAAPMKEKRAAAPAEEKKKAAPASERNMPRRHPQLDHAPEVI